MKPAIIIIVLINMLQGLSCMSDQVKDETGIAAISPERKEHVTVSPAPGAISFENILPASITSWKPPKKM